MAEQGRIVRLPLNKVSLINKIVKALCQLEQEFEREPTIEELATLLDVDPGEISATLGVFVRHISMDAPLADGEENALIDVMRNPNADSASNEVEHFQSLHTEINRLLLPSASAKRSALFLLWHRFRRSHQPRRHRPPLSPHPRKGSSNKRQGHHETAKQQTLQFITALSRRLKKILMDKALGAPRRFKKKNHSI